MSDESEYINDLWEDMDRLNSLYEEMMWDNDDILEFVPDYKNNRIIIKNKSQTEIVWFRNSWHILNLVLN